MKKPPTPKLVTVAIFTTVTIVFWVFFSVYRILISNPDINIPKEILEPMDTTLDTKTLEGLPNRSFTEEGQEKPLPIIRIDQDENDNEETQETIQENEGVD